MTNGLLILISLTHAQPGDGKDMSNSGRPVRAKQLKDHAVNVPEKKGRIKFVIKASDQKKKSDIISSKSMNESVTTSLDIHIKGLLSVPPQSKSKKDIDE